MTREEASIIIGNIPINGDGYYTIPEYQEAKAMAIKALVQQPSDDAELKDIFCMGCEYKEQEQQPCEDYISRQEAINCVTSNEFRYKIVEDIKTLPSVTPKEKTGHWIVDWSAASRLNRDRSLTYEYRVHCDRCRYRWDYTTDKKGSLASNFCPNCGRHMVESQESEDKNG